MKTYHNTNLESGEVLELSRRKASFQQERVLSFFQFNPRETFTPDEIHSAVFADGTPLTSVRRAMTNLTDAGKLEKTEKMRMGSFNKMVHTWRLKQTPSVTAPPAGQPSLWP